MEELRYIELFSGIGAFSQAIGRISKKKVKCVFAADINKDCANIYKLNLGLI